MEYKWYLKFSRCSVTCNRQQNNINHFVISLSLCCRKLYYLEYNYYCFLWVIHIYFFEMVNGNGVHVNSSTWQLLSQMCHKDEGVWSSPPWCYNTTLKKGFVKARNFLSAKICYTWISKYLNSPKNFKKNCPLFYQSCHLTKYVDTKKFASILFS